MDITNEEHVATVVADLTERWGMIDGAVHAIAFAPGDALGGNFLNTPAASAETAFLTSAFSFKTLAVATLPLMQKAGGGSLVGLDFDNRMAWPAYDWMGVAKSALQSICRYLARDLGEHRIRANLVSAGPLKTVAAKSIPGFEVLHDLWNERAPLQLGLLQPRTGGADGLCAAVGLGADDHRGDHPRRRGLPCHGRPAGRPAAGSMRARRSGSRAGIRADSRSGDTVITSVRGSVTENVAPPPGSLEQLDISLHHLGQPADDAEAKAGATPGSGCRPLELGESLKDPIPLIGGNPRPVVDDGDVHLRSPGLGDHLDRAPGCVLGGVLEDVQKDAIEVVGVGQHRQVVGLDIDGQLGNLHGRRHLGQEGEQANRLELDRHRVPLEPADDEEVFDQALQTSGLAAGG